MTEAYKIIHQQGKKFLSLSSTRTQSMSDSEDRQIHNHKIWQRLTEVFENSMSFI